MKKLKIGACDWGLPGGGLYATKIAYETGIEALSLKLGLYENDYPLTYPEMQKIYKCEQQKYGVEYCAIALNDFDNIPMHARKGTKEYKIVWDMLMRAVPTAHALGVKMIQVPAFSASEIKTEEDMEHSSWAFQYLCDQAGEYGIDVASENCMTPEKFKIFHEMVDRENFYLYYDSQNYKLNKNYDQVEILEKSYEYLCDQLHVKDGNGALSGSILGTGDTGFFEVMETLRNKRYTGYIILENYYDQLPLRTQGNPYELLKEDIRILKEEIKKFNN